MLAKSLTFFDKYNILRIIIRLGKTSIVYPIARFYMEFV
jgi:hypothetical protein